MKFGIQHAVGDPAWTAGIPDPAAVTRTIRLCTFVLVPAYRNPFAAAHRLATLQVSAGARSQPVTARS